MEETEVKNESEAGAPARPPYAHDAASAIRVLHAAIRNNVLHYRHGVLRRKKSRARQNEKRAIERAMRWARTVLMSQLKSEDDAKKFREYARGLVDLYRKESDGPPMSMVVRKYDF